MLCLFFLKKSKYVIGFCTSPCIAFKPTWGGIEDCKSLKNVVSASVDCINCGNVSLSLGTRLSFWNAKVNILCTALYKYIGFLFIAGITILYEGPVFEIGFC